MPRRPIILACLLFVASCGGSHPPAELAGLWSAGPAACEAGVGIRFTSEAIETVYDERSETLFANPHYTVEGDGDARRVRIEYDLPRRPGGARSVGARGMIVLTRGQDGRIIPETHNLLDARTGAARLRIADDPARQILTLQPCGQSPWSVGLRGLT